MVGRQAQRKELDKAPRTLQQQQMNGKTYNINCFKSELKKNRAHPAMEQNQVSGSERENSGRGNEAAIPLGGEKGNLKA